MKMTVDMDKFPKMADLNTREVDINVVKQTLIKLAVGLCRLHLRKITCNEYWTLLTVLGLQEHIYKSHSYLDIPLRPWFFFLCIDICIFMKPANSNMGIGLKLFYFKTSRFFLKNKNELAFLSSPSGMSSLEWIFFFLTCSLSMLNHHKRPTANMTKVWWLTSHWNPLILGARVGQLPNIKLWMETRPQ